MKYYTIGNCEIAAYYIGGNDTDNLYSKNENDAMKFYDYYEAAKVQSTLDGETEIFELFE